MKDGIIMTIRINRLLVLGVVLFLISIGTVTVSATSKTTLTVSSVTADMGKDVIVPVVLSNNTTGVLGMQLSLSYDSRLTLKSIEQGEALSTLDLTPINDFSANPCTILLEGLNADVSNGTIVVLTFTTPSNTTGDFDVNISYKSGEIYDNNMDDIDLVVVNGKIKVEESGDSEDATITKSTISVSNYIKTTNDIKLDVYASSSVELTGTIIVALYNSDGSVKTVELYPVKSTVNVTLNSTSGKYIKIMWWNMNGLVPLTTEIIQIDL